MTTSATIPFEKKMVFLKQVRVSELEEVEQRALSFFFPGYHEGSGFEKRKLDEKSLLKDAQDRGFEIVRDNNQTRRYAGDFSLPRSSYFTVCRDSAGDDGGLLLHELSAYAKPQTSGLVQLYDTTDPGEAIEPLRALLKPGTSALFCIPQDLKHFSSPFRAFVGLDANSETQVVAIIPTQLIQIGFERLIDLRMPATRQWFVTEFTRLENKDMPGRDGTKVTMPVFPLAGPLDDFKDLLPTLMSQALGDGTGVTQAAGSWLRQLGADALIFPSARVDVSVSFAHGNLDSWYGWNLVDYRGAPVPTVKSFVNLSPEWDRHPTTLKLDIINGPREQTEDPVEFSHVKISTEDTGSRTGTMMVRGIEITRAAYHEFGLWTHYTGRMGDLGSALIDLTLLAASDGKRGIYISSVADVSRMFLAALLGDRQAKATITELPSMPQVASEPGDHAARIQSFLALCD